MKAKNSRLQKKKIDFARELLEWADSIVFAFVGIVLIFAFLASVFYVNQSSMTNTLQDGEMIMISRLPYKPVRGDIILFTKHGWHNSYNENTGQYNPLVKRVIGLPGDVIDFVSEGESGKVYLNGEELLEPYIRESMTRWSSGMVHDLPLTVPDGSVFVMGDNRNSSQDSRNADISFIDKRSILGRVILRITPFSKFGPVT